MSRRATSTFTIDSWDEEPYDDHEGVRLSRARVTKTFSGVVAGRSTSDLRMAVTPPGSAVYVALERIVGPVDGKEGSFVLHHTATTSGGAQSGSWPVVPDSGTGQLEGLRGQAEISVGLDGGHTLILDYDFA